MRVAIIAALSGELKPLVNTGWRRVPTQSKTVKKWVCGTTGDDDQWIAVCGGIGANAARRAFAEAETDGTVDRVISVGWAGALNEEVHSPRSFVATAIVDAQTGERFQLADGERKMVLVSTARVADEAEKRRLAAAYNGAMVDMESAAIVRLAHMRGIPVCCVKAISDDLGDKLPDFNPFVDPHGQMKISAFMRYVAVRPKYWGSLVRLGRTSSAAARNLASAVSTILGGPKDFAEINRTGSVDW